MKKRGELFLPFTLTIIVIVIDQLTKWAILKTGKEATIIYSLFGDFINIILVYNKGAAFSLGYDFQPILHFILLKLVPLIIIIGFIPFYFKINFSIIERWLICAILGGGIGNLIDRFFRSKGVVDFIDIKFYGILGFERWPTFNIADASVVIAFVLFIIYGIVKEIRKKKEI